MDRAQYWPMPFHSNAIDSHVIRPGYTTENWPKIVESLLGAMMPPEMLHWAESYRTGYIEAVRHGDAEKGNLLDGLGRNQ